MAKKRKGADVNKSELIRKMFDDMGEGARARDVFKKLVADGHKVSRALISNVLKRHTGAPISNGRKAAKKAAKVKTKAKSAPMATARVERATMGGISVESLLAAKKFAKANGGVAAAKKILDVVAQLG